MRSSYSSLCLIILLVLSSMAWGQDTFTGSRGFAPTFKTLEESTTAPKANLSIQIPGNIELNGCVRFVKPEGDTCLCGQGSADSVFHDTDCDGVYDPGEGEFLLGSGGDGGGGGGSAGLDFSFDVQNHIDSVTPARPLRLSRAGDDFLDSYIADDGTPTRDAQCDGGTCSHEVLIFAGQDWAVYEVDLGPPLAPGPLVFRIDPYAATPNEKYPFGAGREPLASVEWTASAMFGDGNECDGDPTNETINGAPSQGMHCPMASFETDGFIYGLPVTWRGDWEKTADVTFSIKAYLITDGGAGTWFGQVAIQCVSEGETPGAYGTEVALNLTPAIGDDVSDEIHDVAAAVVDTDTTGANCDAGDTLYWRWRSCDTDATPSIGCTSSAGFENDMMSIFSVRMEYKSNSLSE